MVDEITSYCLKHGMTYNDVSTLLKRLEEIPNGINRFYSDIKCRSEPTRMHNITKLSTIKNHNNKQ